MANFIYTRTKRDALRLLLIGTAASADFLDLRACLVMTGTTADAQEDAATTSAFTGNGLYECDATSYARVALTSEAVAEDTVNNRAEFSCANLVYTSIGSPSAGTAQVKGIVLVAWGGTIGASVPVAWIDTVSSGPTFPFWPNGGTVTFTIDVEGLLQQT